METWMSWAMFLAIGAAAYWYYVHQNNNAVARGRSTTGKSTTNSLKDAVNWDTESKPKSQKPKAKAPRKSVKATVQDAGNKAAAAVSQAAPKSVSSADESDSKVAPPAAAINKAPSGKDVSDMLGERSVSPAVMSIKPSEKPARSVKAQTQKTEAAQETKKQRQNRKKVEEAKAAREEEEKARKALEEKQRRVAREARGEPAKNGLGQSKAPATNAWTEVPSRGAVQAPKAAPQLLDTFEAAPAPTKAAPTNGTTATPASYNGLPSEEEQVRLAMEDSAWTTVPKGGKTKRKTVNEELAEEREDITVTKAPQAAKSVRPTETLRENKNPSSRYQILAEEFKPTTGDDADDWAVM
ncbi:hypothetical protein PTMSG1_01838 [Pyrenophora teres f. maculata]|nr:hypothetical protein PTMSG1_01838 [Pyrenophora teres f. maculata]